MYKIRLETGTLHQKHQSGVATYTRLLKEALLLRPDIELSTVDTAFPSFRVYNKLHSYGLALPFDITEPAVDLTIFPNFSAWPTLKTRLKATVIHDLTYLHYPEYVEEKNLAHLRRVVPRAIHDSDFIVTVSHSIKKEIIDAFSISPERCIVTPIPPDKVFFEPQSKATIDEIKKKYGIKKEYIYFIGNLEPRKSLTTLIEAYKLLPKNIKERYSLVLAGGQGWNSERTRSVLDQAIEIGEDIQHIGFIDQSDSPALFQAASLFVMPSIYEGFGVPILEAMAGGTPVVASNIPPLNEIGGSFINYADPQNPTSFADAITTSLRKPQKEKDSLQAHAKQYSWDRNIDEILKASKALQ